MLADSLSGRRSLHHREPARRRVRHSIEASYKLGDQQVTRPSRCRSRATTTCLRHHPDINLESIRSRTLPLLINGVGVSPTRYLFPGSYLLTSGNEYANYGNGPMVIKHPDDYPNAYDLRPEMTKAGTERSSTRPRPSSAACVKEPKSGRPAARS